MSGLRRLAAVLTVAIITLAAAHAQTAGRQRPAGEGVICAWAIYTALAEVGDACFAGRYPEYQAMLRESVSRIDAYVMANAQPTPTQEQFETFKRQQGNVGSPREQLCSSADVLRMYEYGAARDVAVSRAEINELLARPGQPTWGTCL